MPGVAATNIGFNVRCPGSDCIVAAFGLHNVTNLAHSDLSIGDLTLIGGASINSAGDEGPALATGNAAGDGATIGAAGLRVYPTFELLVRFKNFNNTTAVRWLTTSNPTTSVQGCLSVFRPTSAATTLTVQIRDQGTNRQFLFTGRDFSSLNTLQVWQDGSGLRAQLNGTDPDSTVSLANTYTGPAITNTGSSWMIGRNAAGTAESNTTIEAFCLWNRALTTKERERMLYDPHLYKRQPPGRTAELAATTLWSTETVALGAIRARNTAIPSNAQTNIYYFEAIDGGTTGGAEPTWPLNENDSVTDNGAIWSPLVPSYFLNWATPTITRIKTTSAFVNIVLSPWRQTVGTIDVRTKVATTKAGVNGSASVFSGSGSTAGAAINYSITGLSQDTTYYYQHEWSDDSGSNWYPFPEGIGRFVTLGSNSPVVVRFGDDHTGQASTSFVTPSNQGRVRDCAMKMDRSAVNDSVQARARIAVAKTAKDVFENTSPTFIVLGGDHSMTGLDTTSGLGDTHSGTWRCWRSCLVNYGDVITTAGVFLVIGNHEGENRWQQARYNVATTGGDRAMQKQSTIARKRSLPGPTNSTYTQGGETGSSADWIPALGSARVATGGTYDAAYRATFITDAGGENASPLENYYAFETGGVLFIFLDSFRYNRVGAEDDRYRNEPQDFTLGQTQKTWMLNVLKNSTATKKVIVCHALPGGIMNDVVSAGIGADEAYGRGSGASIGETEPYASDGVSESTDELWMHEVCREQGITLVWQGHNHTAALVEKDGVFYATSPTGGSRSHASAASAGDGWNYQQQDDDYGTSASLGTVDSAGNSVAARGNQWRYNVVGFDQLSLVGGALELKVRQSHICVSDVVDFSTPAMTVERFIDGSAYTPGTPATKQVTISDALNSAPVPTAVACVYDDSAITGTWYNGTYNAGGLLDHYGNRAPAAWQASHAYVVGDLVIPTTPNGWVYRADSITTGTSDITEPTLVGGGAGDWPNTAGGTIVDNGVTWKAVCRWRGISKIDQTLVSNVLQLAQAASASVRVNYVPRWLVNETLTTKAPEGPVGVPMRHRPRYFNIMPTPVGGSI